MMSRRECFEQRLDLNRIGDMVERHGLGAVLSELKECCHNRAQAADTMRETAAWSLLSVALKRLSERAEERSL